MKKKLLVGILLTISMFGFSATAMAANKTEDLFTNNVVYSMAVSIYFDKEMPIVSFISPDGTVVDGETLRSDRGDDYVQYYIANAATGTWKLAYDKRSNTKFEIYYSSYMNPIKITDLSYGIADKDYLPVTFTIASEADGSCQYKLSADEIDANGNVGAQHDLKTGAADLNKTQTESVYLGDLPKDSKYALYLYASKEDGTDFANDYKLTDTSFSLTKDTSDDANTVVQSNDAKYLDGIAIILVLFMIGMAVYLIVKIKNKSHGGKL